MFLSSFLRMLFKKKVNLNILFSRVVCIFLDTLMMLSSHLLDSSVGVEIDGWEVDFGDFLRKSFCYC